MGLTMKNFNVLGVHWKTQFLGGGSLKNQYRRRGLPKRGGAWTVCRFMGGLARMKGVVLLRGGLTPQCTLWGSNQRIPDGLLNDSLETRGDLSWYIKCIWKSLAQGPSLQVEAKSYNR